MQSKITKCLIANDGSTFKVNDDIHFNLNRNGKTYDCFGIITDIFCSSFIINNVEIDRMHVSDELVVEFSEVEDGFIIYTVKDREECEKDKDKDKEECIDDLINSLLYKKYINENDEFHIKTMTKNPNMYVNLKELVIEMMKTDEHYNNMPWSLRQILVIINSLTPVEMDGDRIVNNSKR